MSTAVYLSPRVEKPKRKSITNSVTLSINKIMDFFKTQSLNPSVSPRDLNADGFLNSSPPVPGRSLMVKSYTTDFSFQSRPAPFVENIGKKVKKSSSEELYYESSPNISGKLRHTITDLNEIRVYKERVAASANSHALKRSRSEPFLNSWDYYSFKPEPGNTPKVLSRPKSRRFDNIPPLSLDYKKSPLTLTRSTNAKLSEILRSEQLIFQATRDKSTSVVKAGSVPAIFEWLIFREESDKDQVMFHAFLLSFVKYVSTIQLLQKMVHVFNNFEINQQARTIVLLKIWVENYFLRDFSTEESVKMLVDLLSDKVATISQGTTIAVTNFIAVQRVGVKREPCLFQVANEFVDFHPSEFAQQLTLADHTIFREIRPWEFLEAATNSISSTPKTATKLDNGAIGKHTNVKRFTSWFNSFSSWVAYEIVSTMNEKKRLEILKRFINIAKKLRELRNYNSLMAVLAGLNMSAVRRLKQTWKKVNKGKKILMEVEKIMAPYNNFNNYRTLLSTTALPAVPLVVVHQRDLLFISDGNPTTVTRNEQKLLNFEKQIMLSSTIEDMARCQAVKYTFEENPIIQNYLLQLMVVDEKKLQNLSLLCEPPSKEQP